MKIAVASEGNLVSGHFGHCSQFSMFETDGTSILNENVIDNPGHQPGFLPAFLGEQGAQIIIAGGMGRKAKDLFEARGIQTVTGVEGTVKEVVEAYLHGILNGTDALGHPMGATGAKLTATLMYEMERRDVKYGMVTMCIGGGQGAATIFELVK